MSVRAKVVDPNLTGLLAQVNDALEDVLEDVRLTSLVQEKV